jgi:hypothetical protein
VDIVDLIGEINSVHVNSLSLSKELEARGFDKPQAEGLAEAIIETAASTSRNLVTKDHLEVKIAEVRGEIKDVDVKIAEVKGEIKGDIATLDHKIVTLENKIMGLEVRMVKWMVGLHLGVLFVILSFFSGLFYFLLKFAIPHP